MAGYELGLLPDADPADGALAYWGVDDVPAAVGAALGAGCRVHVPAADVGEGIVTASVRHPDGTIVGFIHNPHFAAGLSHPGRPTSAARKAARSAPPPPYSAGMDLARALEFAAGRRNAVLTTLRADGRPQQSVVFFAADGDRFTISVTDDRAKTRNLRRDPRAALFVPGDDPFTWVGLDGTVELSPVAQAPDDEVVDRLVEYYRRGVGEHEDWPAFRQKMVDDKRLVATFVATSATGILPD